MSSFQPRYTDRNMLLYFITTYRQVSGNSIKYRIGTLTSKCRRSSGTCCYILGIIRYLIGTLTPKVRGYHLLGIRRYLLGMLTSNLRSDLRGGGVVGGSEKVKRRVSRNPPPPPTGAYKGDFRF